MTPTISANNPSGGYSNKQDYTDVATEVDNYMAAIDRVVASTTVQPQLCPYHEHLLTQAGVSKQATCCALHTWFDEKGYEQSAIVCQVHNQLSISKPCTCASIIEAGVRKARDHGQIGCA